MHAGERFKQVLIPRSGFWRSEHKRAKMGQPQVEGKAPNAVSQSHPLRHFDCGFRIFDCGLGVGHKKHKRHKRIVDAKCNWFYEYQSPLGSFQGGFVSSTKVFDHLRVNPNIQWPAVRNRQPLEWKMSLRSVAAVGYASFAMTKREERLCACYVLSVK